MDRQNAFREQEMNMGIKVKKILTGTALIMSLGIFTACGNANKAADEADTNEENMTDNNAANDDNMENNAGENNTNGNSTSGNNAADKNVNNGGTVTDNGTAAEAEAALKDAQAGATVINATLNTTQTTASVYDASIAEIEVRLAKLEKDRKRYENLVKRNAATPIQLEQIVTDYEATRKKLEATKRQKKAALSGVDEVSYRRMNTEAAIQRATAALEMARLNLSYTVVIAPCDGKLGRRSLEEGQFISAGQTITYILPDTQKWIVANYKETQIENLHIGQEVFVTVDAISDKEFKGKVTSISGATGSKYSLVPTDNSAGNFVKIQQRIPVRIDFTDLSKEDNERLAAGMMVVVKAKL